MPLCRWAIAPSRGRPRAHRTMERGATGGERPGTPAHEAQIAGLREVAELLRRQLDDVRADRDAWREQAQAGQRLLTPPVTPPGRRPWWRRLAG